MKNLFEKLAGFVLTALGYGFVIFMVVLSFIHIQGPDGEAWLNQHPIFKFFYCISHFFSRMAEFAR